MSIEGLDGVVDFIIENELIAKGDRVGVGVSGGVDSMALLHFLSSIASSAGFTVHAIHVNHNLRKNARKDAAFVAKFCKQHNIQHMSINVDVPVFAKQCKMGTEAAARVKRYEAFEQAIKKMKLDKVALAHHASDQAETILLHIFRGSGASGAAGMSVKRGVYIRPLLETEKRDLIEYAYRMQVPNIEDETNADNSFSRNFIRNEIIPRLRTEWRNVEKSIIAFGKLARTDDEYLSSVIETYQIQEGAGVARIPLNLFTYHEAVTSRLVFNALEKLGARENIEKKHIDLVITLARTGENGSRTDLPGSLYAVREYEFLTLARANQRSKANTISFKIGKSAFPEYGTIAVSKSPNTKSIIAKGLMTIDVDKVPRTAKWRLRTEGDVFTKFGGGTKNLSAYLIDKKVPTRLRDKLPVLAAGNEILVVAGMEISDKVKVTGNTIEVYMLEFTKE